MPPFTVEAVQELAAGERWPELFDRLIEHLNQHPGIIGQLTPATRQKLLDVIVLMAGSNDAVH
jgi:hypothetical protein